LRSRRLRHRRLRGRRGRSCGCDRGRRDPARRRRHHGSQRRGHLRGLLASHEGPRGFGSHRRRASFYRRVRLGGSGARRRRADVASRPVFWRRDGLRFWLFGSYVSAQSLGICLSPDAVCLRVLDRGRVALNPYTEGYTEVQRLFVCEPELPRELVNPDLLGHLLLESFFRFDHLPAGTSSHTCFAAHKSITGSTPAEGRSRGAPTRAPAVRRRPRRTPHAKPARAHVCAEPQLRNPSTLRTATPHVLAGGGPLRTRLTGPARLCRDRPTF
jgi:hypothetical protein